MPRGGYQKPKNPAPASGPGKFSKRTDGQPIREPDIDRQDIEYGERTMLTEAQKIAKAAGSQGAGASSTAGRPQRMTGQPATRRGGIPSAILGSPDTAPDEPTTAGLGMGPGPGPEVLSSAEAAPEVEEEVLSFLAETYNDPDARAMLAELRAQRAQSAMPLTPSAPVAGGGLPAEVPATSPLSDGLEEPAATP